MFHYTRTISLNCGESSKVLFNFIMQWWGSIVSGVSSSSTIKGVKKKEREACAETKGNQPYVL